MEHSDTPPETAVERAGRAGPRVLVVDDDADMRRYIHLALTNGWQRRGGTITIDDCSEGAEALRRTERERFDAVIADLRMPGLDGLALGIALEHSVANPGIPVLLVTGEHEMLERAQVFSEARTDRAVLAKPFNAARLLAALDALLVAARGT